MQPHSVVLYVPALLLELTQHTVVVLHYEYYYGLWLFNYNISTQFLRFFCEKLFWYFSVLNH